MDGSDGATAANSNRSGHGSRKLATAAVLLGLVISAFEGTVVTTAMPTITRALGGGALYAWVFTGFLLASTLGVMLVGKLADQLGRKPVFLGGVALFLVGSALCGLATSVPALITFRVIQGLGAGAIQPTTMTIGADLYTLEERAAIQSLFTGVWGLANVLGPVLGGFIVAHASWRWVFLVNVPVGLGAALLLAVSYRDPPRLPGKAELAGPLLGGAATALALLALEPKLGLVLRVLLFAAAGLVGWTFLRQQRTSSSPVIPFAHLADRTVQSGLLGGAFAGALLYATAAYVPLWMIGRGYSALTAGFALVPMLGAWAVGSSFGVILLLRGGMRASVGLGLLVCALGGGMLAWAAHGSGGLLLAFVSLGVFGLGLGPAASTATIGPQSVVPWRARGAVTSAVYATRMLGGAVAIALLDLAQAHAAWQVMLIAPVALLGALVSLAHAPAGKMTASPEELGLAALD